MTMNVFIPRSCPYELYTLLKITLFHAYRDSVLIIIAGRSGRAVYGVGLRPLAC